MNRLAVAFKATKDLIQQYLLPLNLEKVIL